MNFRNAGDLNTTLVQGLTQFPDDIDLVVGVPRSGLLAATLFALHRNLPMTDLNGLLEGRLLAHGSRLKSEPADRVLAQARRILVLDDSINSGQTFRRVRESIDRANLPQPIDFGVVYATENSVDLVDHYCEVLQPPRVFSWNIMHHPLLERACVDIDGVLCEDPTWTQNDDGPCYLDFLKNARPLYLPSPRIGWLVTSRLEKYRKQTEDWLDRHDVRYNELVMLDLPDKATRQALGAHSGHKARTYQGTDAILFIESEPTQAAEIARLSRRPVFCNQSQTMFHADSAVDTATKAIARSRTKLRTQLGRAARKLGFRRSGNRARG